MHTSARMLMGYNIYAHALFNGKCLQNLCIFRIQVITKQTNSLYSTNMKTQFSYTVYSGQSCSFLTSAEISKLSLLIRQSNMWVDFLYILYVMMLGSICKTFTFFQLILLPSPYACWTNFYFHSRAWDRSHLCSIMCSSRGLLVLTM
jgi:hypothetical protein